MYNREELGEDEHNALWYTVGYVPFCLMKSLNKVTNATNRDQFIKCLSQMKITVLMKKMMLKTFKSSQRNGLFCF